VSTFPKRSESAGGRALRRRLESGRILRAPGCFDALSVRMIERAGFEAAFLGGFAVAATKLALPDVGLMAYGEVLDQARDVCAATSLPVFADADTGYGNVANVARTILGLARAGVACVMIEDQRWPKRCGHTSGKEVVDRDEAVSRIRAAVRTREEHHLDVVVMARTDANATDGFDEAIWRARAFADAGADLTFLEAPESVEQMRRACELVPGPKVANMVEGGRTPWLGAKELEEMGYALAIYPVALLVRAIAAMRDAAADLAADREGTAPRATFDETRELVGWGEYENEIRRFETPDEKP
jgi:2-methylisocitrate lyase-like PEP mutase family enzyme